MESAISAMLNLNLADVHRSGIGVVGEAFNWTTSKLEHYGVRLPAFGMFEHMLRETIKDEHERFSKAAELTDYYMVHYDPSSAPLMYGKLGILGQAAKPLKQYPHNTWGQFLEYAQIVGMVILFGLMIFANANDWLGWGRGR